MCREGSPNNGYKTNTENGMKSKAGWVDPTLEGEIVLQAPIPGPDPPTI